MHDVALLTYRVSVGSGLLDRVGDIVRAVAPAHRYAIITDSNVAPTYARRVRDALRSTDDAFVVPAGEAQKTRDTWSRLTDEMLAAGYGRDTTVIALGGGVIGDLGGFVAATYMRGLPFIQVPTSLLAMIDASVGGKTGVDTPAGKNLVGAFHQPAAVIADVSVLRTLPREHLRAGIAEAIKHGVIADADYFERVQSAAAQLDGLDAAMLEELVTRSVEIKADVVRRDERENGVRKTLNFGHTIGHAIELRSNFELLHGYAIAIGMIYESVIAERLGVAAGDTAKRVREAVRVAGLPDVRPPHMTVESIITAAHADKKARAGAAEYALPSRIGAMAGADRGWSIPVGDELVREVLA